MPTSLEPGEVFALFELEPTLDLDLDALERDYLRRSRDCHPDHHAAADPDRMVELLDRSARLNDAHRLLRDRWQRAALALEARRPGVLEATKNLDPMFLMDAMEWAESSAEARGSAAAEDLRQRFEVRVEESWSALRLAFLDGDLEGAATCLHQSKYARKALADLVSDE